MIASIVFGIVVVAVFTLVQTIKPGKSMFD